MSLSPVGFLIVTEGDVKFVNVENKSLYQTILNLFNNLISKIDENAANQTRAQEGYYEQAEYKEGQSDEI